tara:strand:+ start:421 stop:708 length:288 start_codon:yes stop_codon:yes gene_type:complete
MRKVILITILFCSTPFVFASDHDLLDAEACKETKEGIGYLLGVADYLFKENEKNNKAMQTEEERKANEKELFGGAIAFSQLAANYSIVFEVWCKN